MKEILDKTLKAEDLEFITEMVNPPTKFFDDSGNWLLKGRPAEKSFLYDIISNKEHGQDVDKWDYFLRDARYANVTIQFDHVSSFFIILLVL